jgi:hypothetical protein
VKSLLGKIFFSAFLEKSEALCPDTHNGRTWQIKEHLLLPNEWVLKLMLEIIHFQTRVFKSPEFSMCACPVKSPVFVTSLCACPVKSPVFVISLCACPETDAIALSTQKLNNHGSCVHDLKALAFKCETMCNIILTPYYSDIMNNERVYYTLEHF